MDGETSPSLVLIVIDGATSTIPSALPSAGFVNCKICVQYYTDHAMQHNSNRDDMIQDNTTENIYFSDRDQQKLKAYYSISLD